MSAPALPVGEEDLHAFVDGQLSPEREMMVRIYLDQNPEAAHRVAAWAAQRAALQEVLAPVAAAPLPPALQVSRLLAAREQHRMPDWRMAAAVIFALAVGGAGGWWLHVPSRQPRIELAMALLKDQAVASHVVYTMDKRHPVEVLSNEHEHLVQWLSNRLDRKVGPPDLSAAGYHFVGGRLLATEHAGAAALFVYENAAGERVSVMFRPMASDLSAPREDLSRGALNMCAWISAGIGYAVAANLPDEELERVSKLIEQQRRG